MYNGRWTICGWVEACHERERVDGEATDRGSRRSPRLAVSSAKRESKLKIDQGDVSITPNMGMATPMTVLSIRSSMVDSDPQLIDAHYNVPHTARGSRIPPPPVTSPIMIEEEKETRRHPSQREP